MGKKVKPLQPDEQLLLRNRARSELLRLEEIIKDFWIFSHSYAAIILTEVDLQHFNQ